VALLPGDRVGSIGGFYAWDLGHLYLSDGRLIFEGERAQFALQAGEIQSVSVVSGPLAWFRTHVALVRSEAATFSLRLADRGSSRRLAKELAQMISVWKESAGAGEVPPSEATPAAQLPEVRRAKPPRIAVVWHFAKTAALMAIGAALATHIAVGYAFATKLVPIAAATIYLIVVFPSMIRRRGEI
jgi:hypothetical protein